MLFFAAVDVGAAITTTATLLVIVKNDFFFLIFFFTYILRFYKGDRIIEIFVFIKIIKENAEAYTNTAVPKQKKSFAIEDTRDHV